MSFVVVYDACVLYPAPVRDLLMEIAISDLTRAKWTEGIHQEWMTSLLKDRPEIKNRIQQTKRLMDIAIPDDSFLFKIDCHSRLIEEIQGIDLMKFHKGPVYRRYLAHGDKQ